MMRQENDSYKALSLLELVVAIGMLAALFTAGFIIFRLSLRTVDQAQGRTEAELLAMDLIELTVSKRNEDWNSLAVGQYYFGEDIDDGIIFVAGQETINEYTRWVDITEVQRNGSDQIVQSGGTVDPDTFKITANVEWSIGSRDFDVELVQYLTNWRRF